MLTTTTDTTTTDTTNAVQMIVARVQVKTQSLARYGAARRATKTDARSIHQNIVGMIEALQCVLDATHDTSLTELRQNADAALWATLREIRHTRGGE